MLDPTMALRRFVKVVANTVFLGGALVMGAMILHITISVIARYLFNTTLPGTIAFVQNYYMIAVTFLPLVVAEIDNQHIEVEVLANRFPRTVQAVLRLAAWILASILFLVLAWVTSIQAWDAYEIGTFIVEQDTKIQTWISYFMLPIGFLSSALICVSRVLIAVFCLADGVINSVATAAAVFEADRGRKFSDD